MPVESRYSREVQDGATLDKAGDGARRSARDALVSALSQIKAGDQAALEELYKRTSAKLFGICHRILDDKSEAEDILQEVYVSVWRKADSFDPAKASPITWLSTMARNRSIDRIRSRGGCVHGPLEEASDVRDERPNAETLIDASQQKTRLSGCMSELDEAHADAIRSAFYDGASYTELAARAAVPAGTMKSWIRRALLKLKDCLAR